MMEVAVAAGRGGLVAAPPLGPRWSSSESSCSLASSSSSRSCLGSLSAARTRSSLSGSQGIFERSGSSCGSGKLLLRWRFERSASRGLGGSPWGNFGRSGSCKLGSSPATERGVGARIPSVVASGAATGWGERCTLGRGASDSLAKRRVANTARRSFSEQVSDAKADDAVQGLEGKAEESKAASGEAVEVMKDTTEKLRAEAEKAKAKLVATAEETAALGKSNLNDLAEYAPDPIKGVAETAADAHLTEKKPGAKIHDFCLGIPYGALLVVGGLLLFIFTGNTAAIRFGVILGGLLLFLSVRSLNVWKAGKSSLSHIQGQAAIASVLLFKYTRKFLATGAIYPWALLALASGGMLAFYLYVYFSGGNPPKKVEAAEPIPAA